MYLPMVRGGLIINDKSYDIEFIHLYPSIKYENTIYS